MKKFFFGLILGFMITSTTIIYSLQVVKIEDSTVVIKILGTEQVYNFEKVEE